MLSYIDKSNSEFKDKIKGAIAFYENKTGFPPNVIEVSGLEWPMGYNWVRVDGISVELNWDLNYGEFRLN